MAYKFSILSSLVTLSLIVVSNGILLKGGNSTSVQNSLEDRVQVMFQELQTLKQELTDTKTELISLQQQYDALRLANTDVAFLAYLATDIVNPPAGQTVIFNEIETNTGDSYDNLSGVFQAPVSGSYNFDFTGASPHNPSSAYIMHIFIIKNGKRESYAFLDHSTDHWIQSSATAVLHLLEGDRVWVEIVQVS